MIRNANTENHGPFRKIVGFEPIKDHRLDGQLERLECGHLGKTYLPGIDKIAKRRRCFPCSPVAAEQQAAEQAAAARRAARQAETAEAKALASGTQGALDL